MSPNCARLKSKEENMARDKNGSLELARRGLLLVVSSPSGAGKTTLTRLLLKKHPEMTISVSITTRPRRPGEKNGVHYVFVSEKEFQAMHKRGEFIESAQVFGHHYGTSHEFVTNTINQGRDILFDIDWQGTQQLMAKLQEDVVRVFLLPPSAEALRSRLATRAQDDEKSISYRMREAPNEISHYAEYDYIIVNDDLETSLKRLEAILYAERQKRKRLTGLADFTAALTEAIKGD